MTHSQDQRLRTWMESSLKAIRRKQAESVAAERSASTAYISGLHAAASYAFRLCADDIEAALRACDEP